MAPRKGTCDGLIAARCGQDPVRNEQCLCDCRRRWLSWFHGVRKPHKILYIDGEMPAETMQERLAAIVGGFTQQPPTDDFFRILSSDLSPAGLPDLATAEGQSWIDAQVGDAEVLILDNISTLVRSGKEKRG